MKRLQGWNKTNTIHHVPTMQNWHVGTAWMLSVLQSIMIVILLFLQMSIPARAQESLSQAAEAYGAGDYVTAIGLYESAILNGQQNGAIYYNLGNAYYQNGFLGRAMLNYRRAAIYLPRDAAIERQIERVQAERIDQNTEESNWLYIAANLTAQYLTVYELSMIVFVIWTVYFLLLGLSLKRKFWKFPARFVGTILLMGILLIGSRYYVEMQRPAAIILSNEAQVYSGAGEDYLPLFTVYEAAEIHLLENRGDWIKFALPNGQQGWILNEHVGYITIEFGINLG